MLIKTSPGGLASPDEAVIERLRRDVAECSVPRDIYAQPDANRACREWVAQRFEALGYEVELQGKYDNVVALPKRREAPILLVGAHYDSVATTPGADDNASAVAVMLEVARAMAGERHVGFIGFNAEEHGLAGSFDFVENFLPSAPFEVAAAHVLEMVGYATNEPASQTAPIPLPGLPDVGDFIGVVADHRSTKLADRAVEAAAELEVSPPLTTLRLPPGALQLMPDAFRSDHAPFWLAGLPALMWTDTSEFRNPNYHQPSDRPDTLDYQFMARVAALVEQCLR